MFCRYWPELQKPNIQTGYVFMFYITSQFFCFVLFMTKKQ